MNKIFVADKIAAEGVEFLRSHPEFEVVFETGLNEEQACERIRDCDAVIVRSAVDITERVLDAAEKLRVIGRAGIGVDNIDVEAATERGIVVLNTPDANATTTAELALSHILSLNRHLPQADYSVRSGKWERSRFMGTELTGKTVGVIGYGTIGRILASRCLGLKTSVVVYDPFVTREVCEEDGVTPMELDELLSCSDYVTLHCPLTEGTRGLLNASRLASMKKGARLINCARGGLIDEEALAEVLDSGHLAGAALDVYASEPPVDSPLLERNDIVFTPHLGASTSEAQVAVGVAIAQQVATYLSTGEAVNAINLPRISAEELVRVRPYQDLAWRLGRLLAAMETGPLSQVEVVLCGRAAELDPHPVAIQALVGILYNQFSKKVNNVNACHLARRQGINLIESRCDEMQDYISLVSVTGQFADASITVTGTLLGDKHPRLVRINDYEVEIAPEGTLLMTRHDDRPGVVGALGELLGNEQVNISRMQVGISPSSKMAIAVVGISAPLSPDVLQKVADIPAVDKVCQLTL